MTEFNPSRRKLVLGGIAAAALGAAGLSERKVEDPAPVYVPHTHTSENYLIELAREHGMQERVRLKTLMLESLKEGPRPPTLEYWTSKVPDLSKLVKPKIERPKWDYDARASILRKVDTQKPVVVLTIDDGFSNLDETLNVLKEKNVKATFFLIGRLMDEKTRTFIERAFSAGCEIANHTFSHSDLTNNSKTEANIQQDIDSFEQIVKSVVREATTVPFMRPFGGSANSRSINAAAKLGYRHILWGVSGDAGTNPDGSFYSPNQLVNLYVNQLKVQKDPRGSIILLHFREQSRIALSGIIDGIRSIGLEPKTLTECLSPD